MSAYEQFGRAIHAAAYEAQDEGQGRKEKLRAAHIRVSEEKREDLLRLIAALESEPEPDTHKILFNRGKLDGLTEVLEWLKR